MTGADRPPQRPRHRPRVRLGHAGRGPSDRRIAVIGLGRFGSALAAELMRRGWDVLGLDADEARVQRHSDLLTHTPVADCTDTEALRQLGVPEFTAAVVAIGTYVEASILVTSNLLEEEVPQIWAKAVSEQHARVLERLGVHRVFLPEQEMGERVAHLVTGRMLNFVMFDDDYALVKTVAPEAVTGRTLRESAVRRHHGVTVVGVRRPGTGFTHTTAQTVIEPGDVIIVTGATPDVEAFAALSQ